MYNVIKVLITQQPSYFTICAELLVLASHGNQEHYDVICKSNEHLLSAVLHNETTFLIKFSQWTTFLMCSVLNFTWMCMQQFFLIWPRSQVKSWEPIQRDSKQERDHTIWRAFNLNKRPLWLLPMYAEDLKNTYREENTRTFPGS